MRTPGVGSRSGARERKVVQETGGERQDPDGSPAAGASFDQRLNEARNRHGLDPGPVSAGTGLDRSSIGLVMRVGVELVAAVVVGLAIGWALDGWLKTRPLFLVLFVFLGGAAGIVNVWRLVAPPGATRPPR